MARGSDSEYEEERQRARALRARERELRERERESSPRADTPERARERKQKDRHSKEEKRDREDRKEREEKKDRHHKEGSDAPREKERDRKSDRDREAKKEKDKSRDKGREKEREKLKDREREREREGRDFERERDERQRERDSHREGHRDRDGDRKDRERERERREKAERREERERDEREKRDKAQREKKEREREKEKDRERKSKRDREDKIDRPPPASSESSRRRSAPQVGDSSDSERELHHPLPPPPKKRSVVETPKLDVGTPERECLQGWLQKKCYTSNHGQAWRPHNVQMTRHVSWFVKKNLVSEGSFGKVFRAKCLKTGNMKALKQVKMEEEEEDFPQTALREVTTMMSLGHPNILGIDEVVVGDKFKSIFLVMDLMDHDLRHLTKNMGAKFSLPEIKCLFVQLFSACAYMHSKNIIHRDLKSSNILYSNTGQVKICDFGLARTFMPSTKFTPEVQTLWYRSPEVLLGSEDYTISADMWSMGCILAELLRHEPLFQVNTENELFAAVFLFCGSATQDRWPGWDSLPKANRFNMISQPGQLKKMFTRDPKTLTRSEQHWLTDQGFDLLTRLLALDPKSRISALDALNHPWFKEEPLPCKQREMPAFTITNDKKRLIKPSRKFKRPAP